LKQSFSQQRAGNRVKIQRPIPLSKSSMAIGLS
jgi:hypothetical protein